MNRTPAFSVALLLGMLAVLPSAAQDAAPRRAPVFAPTPNVVAAKGLPNLKQFPSIPIVLPNESAPLELNIASQTDEGRFAGEAVRTGSAPGLVMGLVEPTESGGYMVEFTVETKGAPQKLFQGSIFVAEAAGRAPRKVYLSGICTLMEGEKTTGGPFPFHGTAYAPPAQPPQAPPANPPGGAVPPAGGPATPGDAVTPASPRRRSPFLDAVRRERAGRELGLPKDAVVTEVSPKRRSPLLDVLRKDPVFQAPKNVMEALERRDDLKIFTSLVKTAGLEDAYRKVKITVFAPNDAAFNKLAFGVLDGLRKDQTSAKQYVGYCTSYQHKYLTKGPVGAEELPGDVVDVGTGRLGVSRVNGRLWIMGNDSRRAPVLEENIDAGVGALYVTGVVLIQKSTRFD